MEKNQYGSSLETMIEGKGFFSYAEVLGVTEGGKAIN